MSNYQRDRNENPTPPMALVVPDSKPGKLARVLGMPLEYVQLVKDVCAKGATDEEFCLFLQVVHETGLSPLKKEIWFYKMYDSIAKKELPVIHASIQGRRKAAEKIGGYCPGKETVYEYADNGDLIAATAYVKRKIEGDWQEISFTAYWEEFVPRDKDGKEAPRNKWKTMPRHMLAKCAETHALNRAFPTLENLADTEDVPTSTYSEAFAGGGEPMDEQTERNRKLLIDNLSSMSEILLNEEAQGKLNTWMETATLQALTEKHNSALLQFLPYAKGIYEKLPAEEAAKSLEEFNVSGFEDLDFEATIRYVYSYQARAREVADAVDKTEAEFTGPPR